MGRLFVIVAAVLIGCSGVGVGVELAPPAPGAAWASCPGSEVADDEDPGFQCTPDCPEGMLVDTETGLCVAAPGVPPPPLSGNPVADQPEVAQE